MAAYVAKVCMTWLSGIADDVKQVKAEGGAFSGKRWKSRACEALWPRGCACGLTGAWIC